MAVSEAEWSPIPLINEETHQAGVEEAILAKKKKKE